MSKSPSPSKKLDEPDASPSEPSSPLIVPTKKEPFQHCTVATQENAPSTDITSPTSSSSSKKMSLEHLGPMEDELRLLAVSPENQENSMGSEQNGTDHREIHRKNSGRDSANHSPCEAMLASPSMSSISDNHSVRSNDSGKGGSDVATPPSARTPQLASNSQNLKTSYEFLIPQQFVGKLIGRNGSFVKTIKEHCHAYVYVQKHSEVVISKNLCQVCIVEGTPLEIEKALKMIRERFPLRKYSEITLEQIELAPSVATVSLIPDHLYLKLVEGVNNDTVLSCMVAPDHLFMQQPTHPSYPALSMLTRSMDSCYSSTHSPLLPYPIPENTVCAAFSVDSWHRAIVLSTDDETKTSYVKFLDFGGYAYVENDSLRQIRHDFMLLPFQAAECFLSNIKSKSENGCWPEEAYSLVAASTRGRIIYTQIADYTPDGIPLVLCFIVLPDRGVVFLNRKLVDEGFADWIENEAVAEAEVEGPPVAVL
ncbi:hypothetical protein D910_06197 [Dendroctonus ponderosae]|nr:hypothetical protein D910_06197 [Dendroctonus ponderosae]